jgi:hypothetical protein
MLCPLGFTIRARAPNQVARASKGFVEGVHYWEVICPISLSTLCKSLVPKDMIAFVQGNDSPGLDQGLPLLQRARVHGFVGHTPKLSLASLYQVRTPKESLEAY